MTADLDSRSLVGFVIPRSYTAFTSHPLLSSRHVLVFVSNYQLIRVHLVSIIIQTGWSTFSKLPKSSYASSILRLMFSTRLGKSGLKVSKIIFGTMGLGTTEWQPWVVDEELSLQLLKHAFDSGINTWDTVKLVQLGSTLSSPRRGYLGTL